MAAIKPMQAAAHELARYADIVCAGMSSETSTTDAIWLNGLATDASWRGGPSSTEKS